MSLAPCTMQRDDVRHAEAFLAKEKVSSGIEQPYFASAIGVVLTIGALWGVIILLRIALNGSFTSVDVQEVNAHGHAQIFGWVGLFVMGFAYRMLPALVGHPLPWKRAAQLGWLVMLIGLALRTSLQPFGSTHPTLFTLAQVGSALEIAAITVFSIQISWLLHKPTPDITRGAAWMLRAAIVFFAFQAIFSAVYFRLTAIATSRELLLWLISHFQPPLRDLQIHGFAMMMIFGISSILLPRWFGTRELPSRGSRIVAFVLVASVIAEVVGFLLMRLVGYRWAAIWGVASLALLGSSIWIVVKSRVLSLHPISSRSSKFIRAAHLWLLLSLGMLVLLPLWQFLVLPRLAPTSHAVEIGFSHAYYGSIRHAITVGFVSLMILGMSSRLMERTRPNDSLPPGTLTLPLVLVNLGCALRVFFQAATDIHPFAFQVAGISGILELTGIAVWAAWMLKSMCVEAKLDPLSPQTSLD
ncbi:hypothetical protein IT570_11825 [Candidatus Sumerlaeota bacterium]|nr:hypothetical protein [Candidatus Sumerlaeota bacterium]